MGRWQAGATPVVEGYPTNQVPREPGQRSSPTAITAKSGNQRNLHCSHCQRADGGRAYPGEVTADRPLGGAAAGLSPGRQRGGIR
jgi:hypothetical protein